MMSLLIRADGSTRTGTGHVMRCLALAQGWQPIGGKVLFVQAESTPALDQRLRQEGMEIARLEAVPGSIDDVKGTIAQARACAASWIVADGYEFSAAWQRQIKEAGFRLLILDDYGHAEHYFADVVLNQNVSAQVQIYVHREPTARLLLGTRYALLRREFLGFRDWRREFPTVARKVLVTLGGSDPDNVTGTIVRALADLPDVEATVVVGGSNPNLAALAAGVGERKTPVRSVVNATNMPELMAWADVAVAAAGTTSWELAFMGVPALLLILADNQSRVAQVLDQQGVSKNLGRGRDINPEYFAKSLETLLFDSGRREQMSRAGRALVDGQGTGRVVTQLLARGLSLRRAQETDCRMIWTWANEASVRQASFVSDPIPWNQHELWFSAKIVDERCFYYVASDEGGNPVGQVRFGLNDREGAISLSLAPAMRGRGYGSALILRGVEQFFADSGARMVHAYVKPENQVSIRAFERADFGFATDTRIHGLEARHLILTRKTYDSSTD